MTQGRHETSRLMIILQHATVCYWWKSPEKLKLMIGNHLDLKVRESDGLINAMYSILVHEIEYHPTWAILDIGFRHLVLFPKTGFDEHEH